MRQIIRAGVIAGLTAGPAAAGGERSATSGDRPDETGRVVTLDEDGRTRIMVLDENGRTKLDILSGSGGSSVVILGESPGSEGQSEPESVRAATLFDGDCLAALQAMADARTGGTAGTDLSDEEEAVLDAHCMMSNAGACRLNAHVGCGSK